MAQRIFLTYIIETLCLSSFFVKIVSAFKINHSLNTTKALKFDYKRICDIQVCKNTLAQLITTVSFLLSFLLTRSVDLQVFHGGRYEVAISWLDF
jgi:hypothetical protein